MIDQQKLFNLKQVKVRRLNTKAMCSLLLSGERPGHEAALEMFKTLNSNVQNNTREGREYHSFLNILNRY